MPILFKPIIPTLPKIAKMRGYLLNAMRASGKELVQDMAKTTETWEHQPVFKMQIGYRYGDTFVYVYTEDEVWNYLDGGTSERWAIMSNPFTPKTAPGWIGSQAGTGHAVVRGKSHMKNPQPGIQARLWSKTIQIKNMPKYKDRIDNAVKQGLIP